MKLRSRFLRSRIAIACYIIISTVWTVKYTFTYYNDFLIVDFFGSSLADLPIYWANTTINYTAELRNTYIKIENVDGSLIIKKRLIDYIPSYNMRLVEAARSQHGVARLPDLQYSDFLKVFDGKHDVIAFIHIGKNGGTSFRRALLKARHSSRCRLKESYEKISGPQTYKCPRQQVPCVCDHHYDWTVIDQLERKGIKMAPITMLRNPIQRAVSHFHFAKSLSFTKGKKMRTQSLQQYLNDKDSLLDSRVVWRDGQAGVSWLSATHTNSWVIKLNQSELLRRQKLSANWTYVLDKAIENLHKTLWFGIMEKMDQSLELLKFQTGFDLKINHDNRNPVHYKAPTANDIRKLEKLMPLDLWFYQYATALHDFRWQLYLRIKKDVADQVQSKNQASSHSLQEPISINLESLPGVINGCKSTRYYINCPGGRF